VPLARRCRLSLRRPESPQCPRLWYVVAHEDRHLHETCPHSHRASAGDGLCRAFFSRWLAASTEAAATASDHFLIQKLLGATGYGVRIQSQKISQQSVAATAQSEGLQAGKQTALLLIQQTVEQQDGSLELVGRDLE
jgi:hypothetical protein